MATQQNEQLEKLRKLVVNRLSLVQAAGKERVTQADEAQLEHYADEIMADAQRSVRAARVDELEKLLHDGDYLKLGWTARVCITARIAELMADEDR